MNRQNVRVAAIQTTISKNLEANRRHALSLVEQAAKKGAKIICLPELYNTPYLPQYPKKNKNRFVETIPGKSTKAFAALAKKYGVVIIVPVFEKKGHRYYNSAAVINENGKLLPTYHKIHIPHDPGFYEKNYFEEGDLGYKVYKTKFANFAVLICYDQWFPEAARAVRLQGAEIIFYPTAIANILGYMPPEGHWQNAWETVMRGHAIANSVAVVAVNRVGREDKSQFWGQSFVSDAFGKVLKRASGAKEQILLADVDLNMNQFISESWGFMQNRRPDTYGALAAKKYTRKTQKLKNIGQYKQTKKAMITIPKELGLHMPAEWEKHAAVWLAWPYDETTFTAGRIKKAEQFFVKLISAIHKSERVELFVLNRTEQNKVAALLAEANVDLTAVNFRVIEYADVWTRDYGPIFLNNAAWTKWQHNAYGKGEDPYYTPLLLDNGVFNKIKIPGKKYEFDFVLEGGAIDVNGQGVCLTTEQCLLNPNRNPGKTKADVEAALANLGIAKTIWLKKGLTNDHTDGHIDEIARFVAPDTIVYAWEEDPSDENYEILKKNFEDLQKATDQNENPFKLIPLPMPHMTYDDGTKAPVSYANFYIGNFVVLAATFNDPNDAKALGIIQSLFPDRHVVGLDCSEVIYGGGAVHCVTQQQPL